MTRCSLCLLSVFLLPLPEARAQDRAGAPLTLPDQVLVLPSVGRYGRSPVPIDAVQAQLAAGTWKAPKAGDVLTAPDGKEYRWEAAPFRDGTLTHAALKGGYARGTAAENAWALAKARYDAEQFWYRGNGSVDLLPDTAFDPKKEADRNVILYGNADSNAAWPALLGEGPVQVRRGQVQVGERAEAGHDLACLFVWPRPGSDVALVGAVSGTGLPGMRLADRLPYFTSGVGYPDWVVLDGTSLARGVEGIRGAGYFGLDWKVESGESAWRK